MISEFSKHPSNIAQSAGEYLAELSGSEKTKRTHEDILSLFIESLCNDSSAVVETKDGEFVLQHNWEDYYGGAISSFIDWWIPRKVMDTGGLQTQAPGVIRKWVKWCYAKKYFDKEHYDDYLVSVPASKKKDVQRLKKAEDLLYKLHTPQPRVAFWSKGKIVPLKRSKEEPEAWGEGYMRVVKLEKTTGYLKNEGGDKIGPVNLGKPLVDILKAGDIMNVVVGKFGESWKVLESGGIYGEDSIF